jgi:hypothetical protein
MTTDLRGLDLLDAAIDHIEKHPETWDQGRYRCASGMCLAGWIAELGGGQWAAPPREHRDGPGGEHGECLLAEAEDNPQDVEFEDDLEGGVSHIHVAERAERLIGVSRHVGPPQPPHGLGRDLFDGLNTLGDIKAMRDDLRAGAA